MPNRLTSLQSRGTLRVCWVMSGTSLDGIDIAIAHVTRNENETHVALETFFSYPFESNVREELLSLQQSPSPGTLVRANMAMGELIGNAIHHACNDSGIEIDSIDLIGSHGQTIFHAPEKIFSLGIQSHGTFQIGDPSVIASVTGIVTVGDFRAADCAAGGEGAPLIPAVDYFLFRHATLNRVMLNIGGIANVTVLPAGCAMEAVRGFDTGPGNMIIDALCKKYFNELFDRDGIHAASGNISAALLDELLSQEYFSRTPPKSTGRELFDAAFIERYFSANNNLTPNDLIATATEFTARTIADAINKFILYEMPVDELIVSGGGVHNNFLMNRLRAMLAPLAVRTSDEFGIPADAKEAIGFALLAFETIHERPGNIPAVTGALKPAILGKICL